MYSGVRVSVARQARGQIWLPHRNTPRDFIRSLHLDGRTRLSNVWAPSGGIAAGEGEDAHAKLRRAGFLRQAHSGIFHLLPLGLRVQDKITRLVDQYMVQLGASRVQLSAISSEAIWAESGRLDKIGSELFRFQDRNEGRYLLGPTHEEEITRLVARSVQSYKKLPLRLYQITQKYRDELRPRHGLLRGRDFCMKDLYTFDYTVEAALKTYEDVREAYSHIFIKEMKLPILVAKASSGDMGGSLSHEYHIPTALGEDHVMSCNNCDYVANEEVAESRALETPETGNIETVKVWRAISKDRKMFINIFYSSEEEISTHSVKKIVPDLDPGIENAMPLWHTALSSSLDKIKLINIFDRTVAMSVRNEIEQSGNHLVPAELSEYKGRIIAKQSKVPDNMSFLHIRDGDGCPRCDDGKLTVQKAIELGHTFHLGTRYSKPMNAFVTGPTRLLLGESSNPSEGDNAASSQASGDNTQVHMQMGCHGIGVSRIIGAVANHLADERGLNWPRVIAPYEVVVVYNSKDEAIAADAGTVHDALLSPPAPSQPQLDVILDDRDDLALGWKLKDADLVGYPVMVVLGREWSASRRADVQCRQLGFQELVPAEELTARVRGLLQRL